MNVEELLQSKEIAYKKSGEEYFLIKCLNPEHNDKSPSMSLNKYTGFFKCFSCGFTGSIQRWFQLEIDNSIPLDTLKTKLFDTINRNLQISLPKDIKPYEKEWRNISVETLKEFQAFTTTDKSFEDRIVFPIYNHIGELSNLHSRWLFSDVKPKYLTLPKKKSLPIFYKKVEEDMYLVEGIVDMLTLYDNKIKNVACNFGINVGAEYLSYLKLKGCRHINLLFDGDSAGVSAMNKLKPFIEKQGLLCSIIVLPNGKDVGDIGKNISKFLLTNT